MASNTIDQAIQSYVLGDTNITGSIGTRFYYVEAERDASYPYAVYFLVDDPHEPHSFNEKYSGQARVQINTYDDNRINVLNVSDKIRDRIHLYGGAMDGITVHSVKCSGSIVDRLSEQDIFRARFDALINYKDTT